MIYTWTEAYQAWDNYLDELHQAVTIGDLVYYPSEILRRCDPVAYRCCFNDWADGEGIDTDELTGYPERH